METLEQALLLKKIVTKDYFLKNYSHKQRRLMFIYDRSKKENNLTIKKDGFRVYNNPKHADPNETFAVVTIKDMDEAMLINKQFKYALKDENVEILWRFDDVQI